MLKFSDLLEICDRSLKKDDAMQGDDDDDDESIKAVSNSDQSDLTDVEASDEETGDVEASDEETADKKTADKKTKHQRNSDASEGKMKNKKTVKFVEEENEEISSNEEADEDAAIHSSTTVQNSTVVENLNSGRKKSAKEDIYGRKMGEISLESSAHSMSALLRNQIGPESDENLEQIRKRLKGLMNR